MEGVRRYASYGLDIVTICNGMPCLTATDSRAGAKAGHSDPVVLNGRAIAQRIKRYSGDNRADNAQEVHIIDGGVWHLDVGSSHPGAAVGPKWYGCLPFKEVRELGLKPVETVGPSPWRCRFEEACSQYEVWSGRTSGIGCHASGIAEQLAWKR